MRITMQQNEQDCGLHVLKALGEHFHSQTIELNQLRTIAEITPNGINAYNLKLLAQKIGIILEPFHAQAFEVFKNKNEYFVVGIKKTNFNHYVVIKVKSDYILVFDPARGKYALLFSEFVHAYSGLVFTIKAHSKIQTPLLQLTPQKQPLQLIFENVKVTAMTILLIMILLIISFLSTFFMKIVFDQIIPNQAFNLLTLVSLFFLTLAIFRVFINYLKQLFIKKLALEVELILYENYKSKLVKVDLKAIVKFDKSDLLRRMLLIETCSIFLSSSVFILIEEGIALSVALAILIYINPHFFAIVLVASLIIMLLTLLFHCIVYPLYQDIFNKAIKNFSLQNIRINEITSLKDKEFQMFSDDNLINGFYEIKKREYKLWKILAFKTITEEIIASLVPIILTYIFVRQIFASNNKPGEMLLFLTITTFFSSPLHSLTDYFLKLKQNLINWNYVKEIINLKEEQVNANGLQLDNITRIVLKNIRFSYNRPVLKINQLTLTKSIRITSNNGTGKSTLLKLIALRFLPNFSYQINHIDYTYYNLASIRTNILFLESDHYFPASRIDTFITLNSSNQMSTFEQNIKKYQLDHFLSKNGIVLSHFLKEGGTNLSSGQRQIILLLRLLTRKYKMIVLDEALENVSLENLLFLKQVICDFQKTALFVEVSHTKRYLKNGQEVQLETINQLSV